MGLIIFFTPLIEIFLFIQSGIHWGWVNTLLYFLLTFIIGFRLLKWAMIRVTMGGPARGIAAMVWVLVGLLILIPGYMSDLLALLLAFPPTRYLFFKAQAEKAAKWAQGRVHVYFSGSNGFKNTDFGSEFESQEREAKVIDVVAIESTKTDKQS